MYGNIFPKTDGRNASSENKYIYMEYVGRHHNNLLNTLTYAQKEILGKFDDCWNEYVSLSDKSIFVYAFKLGARLTIEIMSSAKE